jgi:hypothetical protein
VEASKLMKNVRHNERLTNGNTALPDKKRRGRRTPEMLKQSLARSKVLASLVAAGAMGNQFDICGSQRRVA